MKEFAHLTVKGDLNCDLFNGLNLTLLERASFSKTRDQFISGKVTFQQLESKGKKIVTRQIMSGCNFVILCRQLGYGCSLRNPTHSFCSDRQRWKG
jgi:hypothetical protein